MQEQFDSLARDLARGDVSRRRFLRLLGGLGGAAGLAALGIRTAGAQEGDPRTTTGHRRSELEAIARTRPNQAVCAQISPPHESCFLGFCSTTCPGGLFGLAACVPPIQGNGRPRCAAVAACSEVEDCTSDADCGPREFCAATCCPVPKCVERCPENNP